MAFDIKAKIEELIEKIKGDKSLGDRFQKDPTRTVEDLIGVDLPDDQVKSVVDAIKAKLDLGKLGDTLGGLLGKK